MNTTRLLKGLEDNKKLRVALKMLSFIVIIFFISLILIRIFPVDAFSTNITTVRKYVESLGHWSPFAYILLQIATIPLIPVPSVILATVSGVLFGFYRGTLYTFIAWIIGNSINYWLARLLGKQFLQKVCSKEELNLINSYSQNISWRIICISWFIPAGTADIIGYTCGLMRVPYGKYLSAALPAAFILAILTAGAGALIPFNPLFSLLFSVGAIVGLIFFPLIYKKVFKQVLKKRNKNFK